VLRKDAISDYGETMISERYITAGILDERMVIIV